MTEQDIKNFHDIMTCMGTIYGKKIDKVLLKVYWQALQEFKFVEVQWAFNAFINNTENGQFFPKPADIRRMMSGNPESQSLKAWAKVEKAIKTVGNYSSIVFDDAKIHCVINDMGGWVNLCSVTNEDLPFRADEFRKRYRGCLAQDLTNYPAKLIGTAEHQNGRLGFAVPAPVLFGDKNAAIAVYRQGKQKTQKLKHTVFNELFAELNQPQQEQPCAKGIVHLLPMDLLTKKPDQGE